MLNASANESAVADGNGSNAGEAAGAAGRRLVDPEARRKRTADAASSSTSDEDSDAGEAAPAPGTYVYQARAPPPEKPKRRRRRDTYDSDDPPSDCVSEEEYKPRGSKRRPRAAKKRR